MIGAESCSTGDIAGTIDAMVAGPISTEVARVIDAEVARVIDAEVAVTVDTDMVYVSTDLIIPGEEIVDGSDNGLRSWEMDDTGCDARSCKSCYAMSSLA